MSYWKNYKDDTGRLWAVLNLDMSDDIMPPIIGPPDLADLGVSEADQIRIQNGLVRAGIFDRATFLNRRRDIRELLKKLGLSETLEREISSIFIREFF